MLLVVEQLTATGRQQTTQTITRWNPATSTAHVSPGIATGYGTGALVGLMPDPSQQATRVLAVGDTIWVPQPGAVPTARPAPQDPYGTDLALTAQGDLTASGQGDLALVSGIANALAALERRVQTPVGSLVLDPTYGSRVPDAIGLPSGQATALRAYATQALLQDPRVAAVPSVTVTIDGTRVTLTAAVDLVGAPAPVAWTAQVAL
jgi:phage baseplate assembly protein W